MAGLYIRELIMRADARRILIVAPGSLVEQWRDELFEKFGLEFRVFSRGPRSGLAERQPLRGPRPPHRPPRSDVAQRRAQDKLCARVVAGTWWSSTKRTSCRRTSSGKAEATKRFNFAEKLGAHTRHLLLMTATPHNGKEEDFQLFLSLLDSDRFYGKFRDGVHKVDTSDLMRRMVKEEMVKFDGTPLFPERKAYTVNYELSNIEAALYEASRLREDRDGQGRSARRPRKGSVGFALDALQRRLASSPEAIFQSLKRRRERLERRLREEKLGGRGKQLLAETLADAPEDDDDLSAEEQEGLEETLVDEATAARTIVELEAEILILQGLEKQALGRRRVWAGPQVGGAVAHPPERPRHARRRRPAAQDHHLLRAPRHAELPAGQDRGRPRQPEPSSPSTAARTATSAAASRRCSAPTPKCACWSATDAAGEGVNLQNANLMVNYDLPWNPNRLEQRFGRIHRIGQQEVCHLWNLVAKETREGEVYHRLLEKLRVESEALKGRVFDILGEVFEETSLKDLLLEAIRYGDQPEVRARLTPEASSERSTMTTSAHPRPQRARAGDDERRAALRREGGDGEGRGAPPPAVLRPLVLHEGVRGARRHDHPREADRFEVTHVPASIRERDRLITGRNRRDLAPVLQALRARLLHQGGRRPPTSPARAFAAMLHPGHPLMLAVTDVLLEQHGNLLRQGTILVDPADEGDTPTCCSC
jgi:hypothetical protein